MGGIGSLKMKNPTFAGLSNTLLTFGVAESRVVLSRTHQYYHGLPSAYKIAEFWLEYFGSVKDADLVVRTRKRSEITNRNKPGMVRNISLVTKRAWLRKA